MASLSEKLRRERELRGVSLKQISEDTKIGVRFLEALEEDKLELIPGEFYRRSYLRAYARYLGLDEERAVNAYTYTHSEKSAEHVEEGDEPTPRVDSRLKWLALAIAVAIVPALLLLQSQRGATGEAPISVPVLERETIAEPGDAPRPVPGESAPSAPGPAEASLAIPAAARVATEDVTDSGAALRLVLSVEETCWLEIQADGEVVTTGLKEEGFQQVVGARREVRLWLGNAGGVSLWVNDRPVKSLGRSGQVRKDVAITLENYTDFVVIEDNS